MSAPARASRGAAAVPSPGPGFEARPWGGFETIAESPGHKVKRLFVNPGRRLSLQRHKYRAETWIVVSGSPRVIVSGRARRVRARETVNVPRGAWHRIENPGRRAVLIVEVQHGPYLGEDDIERRHDDFGRANSAGPPAAARVRVASRSAARARTARPPRRG